MLIFKKETVALIPLSQDCGKDTWRLVSSHLDTQQKVTFIVTRISNHVNMSAALLPRWAAECGLVMGLTAWYANYVEKS